MGGGLMQLVAYGAQDIYLTGNPQITFFKVVYRRHTNFSMEAIEQTWNGNNGVGTPPVAGRCTATISRNGDLVYRMYLELKGKVNPGDGSKKINVGSGGINTVELEIGGQKIDKHTGGWMNVWGFLTEPNPTGLIGINRNNKGTLYQNMSGSAGSIADDSSDVLKLFVPLQFWFCRNPGLALPLIALQYHEVKVILDHNWAVPEKSSLLENRLWCDYIYLDTDERRRFAQVSHEYLIEQVQIESFADNGSSFTDKSQELNFNHPVKELIFANGGGDHPGGGDGSDSIFDSAGTLQLKLNGHERFAARNYRYFTRTQIWEHHTGSGGLKGTANAEGAFNDGIGVYSFALKPEEHQPSGTCNFSRIDNAQLVGTGTSKITTVYAVNYNVLRIMSGMGGLAYSN